MSDTKICESCETFARKHLRVARFVRYWRCRDCQAVCCEHMCSLKEGSKASCTKCQEAQGTMKYRISTEITHDELAGLALLLNSMTAHLNEDLGTGDTEDDNKARAAMRWIGALQVGKPVRAKRSKT